MALAQFNRIADDDTRREIEKLTQGYPSKEEYFIGKLGEAIGTIAAAFYPREVIVRMSDFKTNEYADLIGGGCFEPTEENPMLGFRGASRYYDNRYRPGFDLECKVIKHLRDGMGLSNIKIMIPFCRTVEEGQKVISVLESNGLQRGVNDLEVYVMAEIPSNILLASEFAQYFNGFSIGSNDLTQLTLGVDRDASTIHDLFDENNDAVKKLISELIEQAHAAGRKVGLCGQAPSDNQNFAQFLVEEGIDSISFNPDALFKGLAIIHAVEERAGRVPFINALNGIKTEALVGVGDDL
jgi:pyruvate,water dikinase